MKVIKLKFMGLKSFRFIIGVIIFNLLISSCIYAQQTGHSTYKPLKIGDTVPDLIFNNMLNHENKSMKLSDFRGQSIIIDFWASWCSSCIAAFPKLIELQNEHQTELKIIPVSNDSETRLKRFYQNNPFPLPTAKTERTDIVNALFPHREIPHYIWINKDRTLYAITSGANINKENIRKFLSGNQKMDMEQKDDLHLLAPPINNIVDSIEDHGKYRIKSLDSTILFQSVISKYDARVTQGASYTRKGYKDRFLSFDNLSISHLFKEAYFGFTPGGSTWDKIYIDIDDSTLVYPNYSDQLAYKSWQDQHSYSYRLVLPPDKANKEVLYETMQNDLKVFFGIEAKFDTLEIECLVLKVSDPKKVNKLVSKGDLSTTSHSIFKISLINAPIEILLSILGRYDAYRSASFKRPELELIDETGIETNIDLELNFSNLNDFQELQEHLKSVGLEIAVVKRTRKMLVLSKKE